MPNDPMNDRLFAALATRRELLRNIGIGGAVLTLPAFLAACSDDETDATGASNESEGSGEEIATFTYALHRAPRKLDITGGFDMESQRATTVGVEPLVDFDENLELQPLLAESWEQPDDLTYVYKIRPGVTFWDGSPLTAADVVASLDRHTDPSSEINYYFTSVASVEQSGKLEVTVKLKEPNVFFQYVPSLAGIVSKAFLDEHGKEVGTPQVKTMGTGAYTIAEYVPDEKITWERRDDYWGEMPPVQQLTFTFIEDAQTRLLAFRSGEIDASDVLAEDARQWEDLGEANMLEAPSLITTYCSFDMQAEPWSDIHVRRAFAHALDKEGLVRSLFGDTAEVATSMVHPAQWGGVASPEEVEQIYAELPQYEFDMDKARDELSQSSVPDGFEASVDVRSTDPAGQKILLSLSENLRELGIELKVNEVTEEALVARLVAHKNPMNFQHARVSPDYPDPLNYPALQLDSKGAVENGYNVANFKDPAVDRLIAEQATTNDRVSGLVAMLEVTAEQLPYLPVYWPLNLVAVRDQFTLEHYPLNWNSMGSKISSA
jgi:peptide/nickel transport system substrate-binding protein